MFLPAVWKKSIAAFSSNDGELDTSTTTPASASALVRPSPVMVLTPVFGEAAMVSCPFCFSFCTTFDPIRPVPPITTIFMTSPLVDAFERLRQGRVVRAPLHHVPPVVPVGAKATFARFVPPPISYGGVNFARQTVGRPEPWARHMARPWFLVRMTRISNQAPSQRQARGRD